MMLNVGDLIALKTNPAKRYIITRKWTNYFKDSMFDLSSELYPEITFPEFEKYVIVDFVKVEDDKI